MSALTVTRYHDISAGHRVTGHESKCRFLHGHNYRIHFTLRGTEKQQDALGRVLDFSVIKEILCEWLEEKWDHKFLIWDQDPLITSVLLDQIEGVIKVPFNPTAENMARYLVDVVGPSELRGTDTELVSVTIDETRKCSASYNRY